MHLQPTPNDENHKGSTRLRSFIGLSLSAVARGAKYRNVDGAYVPAVYEYTASHGLPAGVAGFDKVQQVHVVG